MYAEKGTSILPASKREIYLGPAAADEAVMYAYAHDAIVRAYAAVPITKPIRMLAGAVVAVVAAAVMVVVVVPMQQPSV